MTNGEQIFLGLFIIVFMIALMIGMASIVASFIVLPMARNYKECGTIFLCSAQP